MDRIIPKLRLLIVDDNRDTAMTLARIFRMLNAFDVSFALTPVQAIADSIQTPPDVVISDIDMPRMDGCELATEIFGITGEMKGTRPLMVAVTGMSDDVQGRCETAGFDHFFRKPVPPTMLIQLVRNYSDKFLRDNRASA